MSSPSPFTGQCLHCGRDLTRTTATRHVSACTGRPAGRGTALHLVVECAYSKHFWLHVFASPTSTLDALDRLLRDTWLECCGHLSSFEIEGTRFDATPYDSGWGPPSRSMRVPIGKVLGKGKKFRYEYDFGTTTTLVGRCVGVVEGVSTSPALRLVARNHLPKVPCSDCGEPAAWFHDDSVLCLACLGYEDPSEGEDDGLLPVVNSPRMGRCAYVGSGR